ncbi:hypothetical protein LguiA_035242 [Lonicera macranthoides]
MKIDGATATVDRPSVARVCIEMDLLKNFPSRIWIGSGFWQRIVYEIVPSYCTKCYRQGHNNVECKVVEINRDDHRHEKTYERGNSGVMEIQGGLVNNLIVLVQVRDNADNEEVGEQDGVGVFSNAFERFESVQHGVRCYEKGEGSSSKDRDGVCQEAIHNDNCARIEAGVYQTDGFLQQINVDPVLLEEYSDASVDDDGALGNWYEEKVDFESKSVQLTEERDVS